MKTAILKRLATVALMAIGLCGANGASAAKSAKAVEYSDGRMVYYYDDITHTAATDVNFVKQWTATANKTPETEITTAIIDSSFAGYKPTSLNNYFRNFSKLTTIIGLENLDTSAVTSMEYTFLSCSSLTELDITTFKNDALTKVTSMFQGCKALSTIYATAAFDCSVPTITSRSSVFYNCSANLKGDQGSTWSNAKASADYARLDGGADAPGFFSRKYLDLTVDSTDFATKHVAGVSVKKVSDGSEIEPTEQGGTTWTLEAGLPVVVVYTPAAGYAFDGAATYEDNRYATDGLMSAATLSGDDIPTAVAQATDVTLTIDATDFVTKHVAGVVVRNAATGDEIAPKEPDGTAYSIQRDTGVTITYTAATYYEFGEEPTWTDGRFATSGFQFDRMLTGDDIPTATAIDRDVTLTVDTSAFADKKIKCYVVKMTADGSVVNPSGPDTYTIRALQGFEIVCQAADHGYFLTKSSGNGRILDSFKALTTYAETGIAESETVTFDGFAAANETVYATSMRAVCEKDDPETLAFYNKDYTPVGTVYVRAAPSGNVPWQNLDTVRRVVIDPTMRQYGQEGDGFQYLFLGLSNVTNIEGLTNLDTSKATNFTQMFNDCASVEDLDFSAFRVTRVSSFGRMFDGCLSLTNLDLSTFSSSQTTGAKMMFNNCPKLTRIYVSLDFDLSSLTGDNGAYLFTGCSSLVGGNGTKQSVAKEVGASYARIDTDETPGYFTLKTQTLTIDPSGFAAKRIASVVVKRVADGTVIEPVEAGGGTYVVASGDGITMTYAAEDGYLFASGTTLVDETYAESGLHEDITISDEAQPSGSVARHLTVPTADFAALHLSAVEVRGAGREIAPTATDPNVYDIGEGHPFEVVFTAANGYCFKELGRHQVVAYADGIAADETFDLTRLAPRTEVQDSYAISYYDGRNMHFALRDARYPYSETDSFALYDASSLAPDGDRANARFVGWCETADRSDPPVMELPALTIGDKKLYAKYEYTATDWLFNQSKELTDRETWTGTVVAHASSAKVTAGQEYEVSVPYRIHLPANFEPSKKYPVILHLHGAGSRGSDGDSPAGAGFDNIVDYILRRQIEAILIAPQIPSANTAFGPDGFKASDFVSETMNTSDFGPSWVDTRWNSRENHTMAATPTVWFQAAKAILDEVLANDGYQVDADRVYVTGMSMGGFGTWEMLQRYPGLLAAAIPCCGGADVNQLAGSAAVPVWAFHGSSDTTVYPVRSRDAVAALKAAGGFVRYTEYGADYGSGERQCSNHNCWTVTFGTDDVLDWLFEQRKGTVHETVTWKGGTEGDWLDADNWAPRAPQAGDDVVIGTAANVTLSAATPRYHSVTFGTAAEVTLTMSGWTAVLWADAVTIGAQGTVTCEKGGETKESLSRVFLKGHEVVIAEGGKIDVCGKGYWKAATGSSGVGAGPGAGSGAVGTAGATGGAHGGYGGAFAAVSPMPYDDAADPDDAGSSGGLSATSPTVSAGGGVVRFELTGPLTVDGSILANAEDTSKVGTADWSNDETAGAGGSINLEVGDIRVSDGKTGYVRADGGSSSCPHELVSGRAGAGGRIAMRYQPHVQNKFPFTSAFPLKVSAEHGFYRWIENEEERSLTCVDIDAYGSEADLGTIWMGNAQLMRGFGAGLDGVLLNADAYQYHASSSYNPFKVGHARVTGSFNATVISLSVSAGARLELGGDETVGYAGGARHRCETCPTFRYAGASPSIAIQKGGRLDIYAPKTDSAATAAMFGTTSVNLTVNGTLRLWSDPETGVAPRIKVKSFVANDGSLVSAAEAGLANDMGFDGGIIRLSAQSYNQKAGAVFSVSGGNGLVDIWSWQPVELGERVYTTDRPQKRFGQTFAGTFDLGENGRKQFSTLRGEAKGIMMLVR